MRKTLIALTGVLAICMAASCNSKSNYDPNDGPGKNGKSGKVAFKMSGVDQIATKGTITTTESINKDGEIFVVNAWLGSTNRYPNDKNNERTYDEGGSTGRVNFPEDETDYHFIKNADVTYKSGDWFFGTEDAKNPFIWRNAVPTTFWSYHPKTLTNGTRNITFPIDKAADSAQGVLSFTYTVPSGTSTDAVNQSDLLFAYNLQEAAFGEKASEPYYASLKPGTSDVVNIHFYHALAAIRFDISAAVNTSRTISEIYLNNVAESATCTATGLTAGNSTGDPAKNAATTTPGQVVFAWTNHSGTTSCSQSFVSGDFTEKSLDGTTDNALMALSSNKFFFLIPQVIAGNGVSLGIKVDGKTQYTALNHSENWEAGKIYTYKLVPGKDSTEFNIVLVVEDWVDGSKEIAL